MNVHAHAYNNVWYVIAYLVNISQVLLNERHALSFNMPRTIHVSMLCTCFILLYTCIAVSNDLFY